MISAEQILEEYTFWASVADRTAELYLQTDGVMDEVVRCMCQTFHNALYGNDGKMKTEAQWNAHLLLAQKTYDRLKDLQLDELDAVLFYKARAVLWATAIVAGLDPHEVVDGKEEPVECLPDDDTPEENITDITTEIV